MCGICGTTRAGDGRALARMSDAMRHRGPDDAGTRIDPEHGVGIAARRLAVIDVAGGHQPVSSEDGTVWAVLNGEIYNHRALFRHLRARGHRLSSRCDTETLVHLYEEHGDDLTHALEGMFAFAVWDGRRRRLLLGRDRFGEKPLFLAERGGHLAFASELDALRQGVDGLSELDADAVDEFFAFGYVGSHRAIVEGAAQLPPGHTLSWDLDTRRSQTRCYWRLPTFAERPATEPLAELVEEARPLLRRAVASRLVSDVPIGILLSGGVDSTLVAALAVEASPGGVRTFTVEYDVGHIGEGAEGRRTARVLGTEHHEVVLSSRDVARQVPRVVSRTDQPMADQALVATHAVAEHARRTVTVAVSGEGADELFGGYPRYAWLARARRAQRLGEPAMAAAAATLEALPLRGSLTHLHEVFRAQSPVSRHAGWVAAGPIGARAGIYGDRLAAAARRFPHGGDAEWWCWWNRAIEEGRADDMDLDLRRWLPGNVLAKMDRASMMVSLEVRTPFLSRELAEFAASVPPSVHRRGRGKAILRRLLASLRPAPPIRAKTAFRVPAASWLRGPLAPELRRQLRGGAAFDEGWLDRAAVSRLVDEHGAGRRDHSDVLWRVLSFGLWLDRLRAGGER